MKLMELAEGENTALPGYIRQTTYILQGTGSNSIRRFISNGVFRIQLQLLLKSPQVVPSALQV